MTDLGCNYDDERLPMVARYLYIHFIFREFNKTYKVLLEIIVE